ncbi:MAG: TonB family protein [Rubrivivax sp.]|nr:TonB family protein [Pyrinomonadaceae bacterium]
MNLILNFDSPRSLINLLLLLSLVFVSHTFVHAQTPAPTPTQTPEPTPLPAPAIVSESPVIDPTPEPEPTPEPTPTAESTTAAAETDAAHKRLARARTLAAIGKLAASANELETLRVSSKDESVRDVARILLMAIFVEMPDYARAAALLGEAYSARTPGQIADAATHSYFALAGQTINAVRTHLERYRSFGVNVSDTSELPAEANSDLEQLRTLLELVVKQAKALHVEQIKGGVKGGRGLDAAALLEDAATVRMRIARHEQDRSVWQTEVSEARQHLFSSEMRIASINNIPAARAAAPPSTASTLAASGNSAKKSGQPSNEQSRQPVAATNAQPSPPAQQPGATTPPPDASAANAKKGDISPVAIGSLLTKAKQRVSPNYPATARAARVVGVVTVFLLVNEKGDVESVQRADGPPQLQQAAADAARRWRFNPTVIDGQPMRVTGYLSFNFTANN